MEKYRNSNYSSSFMGCTRVTCTLYWEPNLFWDRVWSPASHVESSEACRGLAYNTANAVGSSNVGSSSMPGESQQLDVRKSTRTWSHDHFSAYRFQEDTCNSSIFNFGPPVLTSLFF